jgi:hypothetical protein
VTVIVREHGRFSKRRHFCDLPATVVESGCSLSRRAIVYDRVPQIPDPKQIAVAQLVGAGFKPALAPQDCQVNCRRQLLNRSSYG